MFRKQFYIPPTTTGEESAYFCGNSLGLQPKKVAEYLMEEVEDWRRLGVEGHIHAKNAWVSYHELFSQALSKIVGAKPEEVIVMNGLTTNLHLLMVSFYRPNKQKFKILIEKGAFPSDKYAVDSQLRWHGFAPETALVEVAPREGEHCIRLEDIEQAIETHSDSLALILLGGVNYYTGQLFPLQKIAQKAQAHGICLGYDLAHAVGNVPLDLHEWGVDFAAWCHYKYLNAGAGATAGAFVHQKHHHNPNIPRFEGWWGTDKSSRFQMLPTFSPIPTAEAWQLSNAPVFSMSPLRASLEIFEQTDMLALRKESIRLTNYLERSLKECLDPELFEIITPQNPAERGAQLSVFIHKNGKQTHQKLTQAGVIADWREPNVLRLAPAPLYNNLKDIDMLCGILTASV